MVGILTYEPLRLGMRLPYPSRAGGKRGFVQCRNLFLLANVVGERYP